MTELVREELVELNLREAERENVISELSQLLENEGCLSSREEFLKDVFHREAIGNTAVGFGVAIPHGKSSAVKEPAVVFGRSETGILWNAEDESLVHLIFLLAVPSAHMSNEHLKILAQLSRALINEEFRQRLSDAQTAEEILSALRKII